MILPDNKKYLLYIKTAKTGGTSFLNFLKKIKPVKSYKRINNKLVLEDINENDIIMMVNDNLFSFKKNYRKIFDDSYKILISRDPYTKCISCYNYHPSCKNLTLKYLLKNENNLKYDSTMIDYKVEAKKSLWNKYSLFTHLYLTQTSNLIENENLLVDKIIRFENMKEEIDSLFEKININISNIKMEHLNKTNEKRYTNLDKEEINLINKMFEDDFKYLNYKKK